MPRVGRLAVYVSRVTVIVGGCCSWLWNRFRRRRLRTARPLVDPHRAAAVAVTGPSLASVAPAAVSLTTLTLSISGVVEGWVVLSSLMSVVMFGYANAAAVYTQSAVSIIVWYATVFIRTINAAAAVLVVPTRHTYTHTRSIRRLAITRVTSSTTAWSWCAMRCCRGDARARLWSLCCLDLDELRARLRVCRRDCGTRSRVRSVGAQ